MQQLSKNHPKIKRVIQFFNYCVMRAKIMWFQRNLRLAVRFLKKMPVEDTGHIITKWKWDASQISDPTIREAMLTGVYNLEKYLKERNEQRRA